MTETTFDRDAMARHYAELHRSVDPGVKSIYYLPAGAPEREIRLLEVNDLVAEWQAAGMEPIDYGVDRYTDDAHKLFILDVTPTQWGRIASGATRLPAGWTLDGKVPLVEAKA